MEHVMNVVNMNIVVVRQTLSVAVNMVSLERVATVKVHVYVFRDQL